MYRVDTVVIGAGVVGLAIAREVARSGREVIVLESTDDFGNGNSSRNSEVVHAGIYYPKDSLKARFCVRGRDMLYRYCAERRIDHRRCGKLIVATEPSQSAVLSQIAEKARGNGVTDLREISAAEANELEPRLRCVGALHSPSTGIIDSHDLMSNLLGDAEAGGAAVLYRSPVFGGEAHPEGVVLHVGGDEPTEILAARVFNCAGLAATKIASKISGVREGSVPALRLAKGNYFRLSGRSPFSRLVYPVPEAAGLGVHLTLDLAGRARFGPDVEWVAAEDYEVDPTRADVFYGEIRKYWPELPDGSLVPDYSGIRPKITGPLAPAGDFFIQDADRHGVPGLVNLFGIESPGLTSSLALAEWLVSRPAR